MLLTFPVERRLAHQAQRQGWNSASWRSAEAWVRPLLAGVMGVPGTPRGALRFYLPWESGSRNDVGAAMTPAPCL